MQVTEAAGGFTGVIIAMYATGSGAWSTSPAHFDWFEYRGDE
ncbi:hypothetical protein [Paenibacillus mucilaginosus]|uniref:Xylan 1,4-beta-xylosidase n=1 Tax=Paenibacillus mucilaginosus (strain KNP414) TaxID=1036673 RepID=F8FQY3_PAEMK|nr:hypothetical protein [Paenibacillus mucilaginosus]AEI40421.1 Xylan 1,4-beta-xylosidase [Paenibacillus mucilaginosus KNP414]MCG7213234.1 xylan 1,4-beta-xylosidase [Paenibacillus mucilaginosus]WDM29600.1 xylan 1,4-beta-xylosidase [Paenibacillus mucilaginosus]